MRRIDPSVLVTDAAQAAADRDRGGMVTAEQCRRQYGLKDAEIAMLGPPRIGAPLPGSGEPTQVFRLEVVLELVERLQPECEARERAAAEVRSTQLGVPAAVRDDETTVAARGAA
jgi:hypothetical protein